MFRVKYTAHIKTKSRLGIVLYVTFIISILLAIVWTLTRVGKPFQRWLADTTRILWLQQKLSQIIPNV